MIHIVSLVEHSPSYVVDYSCAVYLDRFDDQEQVWVGLQNWIYSRQFDVSGHSIDGKSVWLKCDGIDTVANIRYVPSPAVALPCLYNPLLLALMEIWLVELTISINAIFLIYL